MVIQISLLKCVSQSRTHSLLKKAAVTSELQWYKVVCSLSLHQVWDDLLLKAIFIFNIASIAINYAVTSILHWIEGNFIIVQWCGSLVIAGYPPMGLVVKFPNPTVSELHFHFWTVIREPRITNRELRIVTSPYNGQWTVSLLLR